MSEGLTFAPLTEALLPRVLELEKLCFSLPWSREAFLPELHDPGCRWLAVLKNGTVIGYAGMRAVLDEGYISNIAVDPEYRRQGVGQALMEALLAEGRRRELSFLTLEVRVSNSPARRLYARLGFREVGLRPGYYERPKEDAVLMTYFYSQGEPGV